MQVVFSSKFAIKTDGHDLVLTNGEIYRNTLYNIKRIGVDDINGSFFVPVRADAYTLVALQMVFWRALLAIVVTWFFK